MMVDLLLDHIDDASWWQNNRVIIFFGSSYQPLFFYQLLRRLHEEMLLPAPLQRCSLLVRQMKDAELIGMLSQTFLGNSSTYWLGDLTGLKSASGKKNTFHQMLDHYQGPHYVICFCSERPSEKPSRQLIQVDGKNFTPDFIAKIARLLGYQLSSEKLGIVVQLVKKHNVTELDQLVLMIEYCFLTSRRELDAGKKYIEHLVDRQHSLIALSEAFFAQRHGILFTMWNEVRHEYSDVFWVTYWSEQLWRAYHVIYFLQRKDYREAKRMSYRLPYVFMSTLWRQYDLKKLAVGLRYLYTCDYKLKRGEITSPIESFFEMFLLS